MVKRKVMNKVPPTTVETPRLGNNTNYATWREDLLRWSSITTVSPSARALTIHFFLEGKAKVASDQIPRAQLETKEGLEILLNALDKIFLPQKEYRMYKLFIEMKRIYRKPDEKIHDYITKYDQLHTNYQQLNGAINDTNAAYWLLESCRLPQEKQDMIMANIVGCTYEKMKDTLSRMNYRELIEIESTETTDIIESTETNLTDSVANKNDEVFYAGERNSRNRDRVYNRPNQRSRGRYRDRRNRKGNPIGKDGKPMKCNLCRSINHFRYACPYDKDLQEMIDKKPGINFSMFVGCASNQNNNLQTLVTESKGYAILDSGCSTTVCGQSWLDNFVESLSDEDRYQIKIEPSAQTFTFGDGNTVVSKRRVTLPCWMGGEQGVVTTDVVDCNIPLLLSRKSMKLAGMILDFPNDKVTVGKKKRDIKLKTTKSGHYALPLSL